MNRFFIGMVLVICLVGNVQADGVLKEQCYSSLTDLTCSGFEDVFGSFLEHSAKSRFPDCGEKSLVCLGPYTAAGKSVSFLQNTIQVCVNLVDRYDNVDAICERIVLDLISSAVLDQQGWGECLCNAGCNGFCGVTSMKND